MKEDELIRYSRSCDITSRTKGDDFETLVGEYLLNPWTDSHETFTIDTLLKLDELIRFPRSSGQSSRSYGDELENLVGAISPESLNIFS